MKKFNINRNLLPMKLHYFLNGGGLSGVVPYLPVLAKQLGISATGLGIIYTVAPVSGLFAKPLFGGLADHLKKIKLIMIFNMICVIAVLYCISFIQPISRTGSSDLEHRDNGTDNFSSLGLLETVVNYRELNESLSAKSTPVSIYITYQFWIFLILYVAATSLVTVVTSLSDAACYEILGEKSHNYGRQRLWGTVGWGAFSIIGGYLITNANSESGTINFSPGFYIMLVLLLLDVVVISTANVRSSQRSQSIFKDVAGLLVHVNILLFLLSIFSFGVLTALQWSFLFLYLKGLGATPQLLGLSLGIQCFLGEMPTFVFSGLIVRKIGHINSISVAMAAFAIRFFWYYFLWNPWYVLPVEVLHGATFGLFYTAMTSYAKTVAPPGTEATMQGLVGATFECLGLAVGNLIGGVAYDYYGGRAMYRTTGIVAVVCCILNLLTHLVNRRSTAASLPAENSDLRRIEANEFGEVRSNDEAEKETFLDESKS